jgi:membrane protein
MDSRRRHLVCDINVHDRRAGAVMFRTFSIPLTWSELITRTIKETNEDDCLGLAAQLAYYLLLALVPAIVFLVALASFFPADTVAQMIGSLRAFAPGDVVQIVEEQLQRVANGQQGGLLTVGIGMALWSSSAAIVSVVDAMNRAYDIEEGRPWWKVRLIAIALTIGLALFIITAVALVMVGPALGQQLASRLGLGPVFQLTWTILQWPIVIVLVAVAVAILNYFAPDAEQDWEWVTPGAALSTVLWLIASLAFKLYLGNFADYNATYGSLGGVIVLMLWFYISALAILVGTEMNAEIEHASPYGKDPGEKVPGERKKLGAAAARAYAERKKAPAPVPQRPVPVTVPADASLGFGWYVAGFLVLVWARLRGNPEKT